jgi:hypothetical protein
VIAIQHVASSATYDKNNSKLTNCVEQSPTWMAVSHSAVSKFPAFYGTRKFVTCKQFPPLVLILSQINAIYTLTTYLLRFVLVLPSHTRPNFTIVFNAWGIQLTFCSSFASLKCVLHPRLIWSSLHYLNIVWWRVQFMKLLIMISLILPKSVLLFPKRVPEICQKICLFCSNFLNSVFWTA